MTQTLAQILALLAISRVTSIKLLNLSKPRFPPMKT